MKKHTYFFSLLVGVMLFASCTDKATMVSKPEDTQEAKQKLNSLALDRKCQVTPEMAKNVAKHFVGSMDKDLANATIKEVIPITDENGAVVWQADYNIYGNMLNLKGDRSFVSFRQLGQYEDEDTGLYYNQFRYYNPSTGGYISQDPIGLAGGNPTL